VCGANNNFVDVRRNRVNFAHVKRRIIRVRVIMAAVNRAKYADGFLIPTAVFPMDDPDYTQLF
jgi:hypothetical protein